MTLEEVRELDRLYVRSITVRAAYACGDWPPAGRQDRIAVGVALDKLLRPRRPFPQGGR